MSKTFRTAYSKHISRPTEVAGVSRTQQHFKEECDVNRIMRRFQQTGELPQNLHDSSKAQFADVSSVPDFLDGQTRLAEYRGYFSGLPASIRSHYGNDYTNMLADSTENLIELGIMIPAPTPDGNVLLDNTLPIDTDPPAPAPKKKTVKKEADDAE